MEVEKLEISDSGGHDSVRLTQVFGADMALVSIRNRAAQGMPSDDRKAAYYLDRDEARRVFNWLGVWLHAGD